MFYIGCHLSVSGGYEHMGKEALSIGANTFQYFTKNPRGRGSKEPTPEDVAALVKLLEENNFAPPLAHAPYTYNPASKDENIREYTTEAMAKELRFLEAIPGALYNFHPGCHVGQGLEVGIQYIADLLNTILTPDQNTTVLLETMAGKGTEIGSKFEELRAIIDLVNEDVRGKVGVCLDTCHVSDAGYDIAGDPDAVFAEFDRIVGLDRLKAIHINDSKNPLGAHKDRHEKIGDGFLGIEGFDKIINCKAVKHLPFYLETPNEVDGYAKEIALLKSMRKE
ncbi:MAG: deoxyribonuclease IV [Ruminococcaceae bacterium]|nr:deoxyribonuclease IV [Oscillospiraceae bacterium]